MYRTLAIIMIVAFDNELINPLRFFICNALIAIATKNTTKMLKTINKTICIPSKNKSVFLQPFSFFI